MIRTLRLKLRPLVPADAAWFHDLNLDPEVVRYTGDIPFRNEQEARHFLDTYDQYSLYRMGRFACILAGEDRVLGWSGLRHDPETGDTDLGFRFFHRDWGRGYATESAMAMTDYGWSLGLTRIVGRAVRANTASVRVLQKVGMTLVGERDFHGMPGVEYAIDRPLVPG